MTEELEVRNNFSNIAVPDNKHLLGDLKRVYGQLTKHWLKYMEHLKKDYPYLYSLSLRTNPFDWNSSPFVQD